MKKIPVVMCIDVEPDERQLDPGSQKDWVGFEQTYEFFSKLRPRLEAATGSPVHFSWFLRMDPQIATTYGSASWVVTRYQPLIQEIKRAGDAIGLHTHTWRWNERLNKWTVDLANRQWIEFCLRMGFDSFRKSLDQSCLYFRFGDRWMDNSALSLIEKLGARFDLTLEPGQIGGDLDEVFTGEFLDYSPVPHRPYRPSKTEFRTPGSFLKRRLWIIPLSVGRADWLPTPSGEVAPNACPSDLSFQVGTKRSAAPYPTILPADGSYEGCFDRADSAFISGWAYDKNRPDVPIDVEIYEGDRPLTRATAATFRQDLLIAGKGDGRHSFNVPTPRWLKDGKAHSIQVKIAGTGFCLNNSPKELISHQTSGQEYLTLNLTSNPWSLCRIVNTLLTDSDSSHLSLLVRSDVSIHPDQQSHLDQTLSYILNHPLIGQLVFETPSEMIRRVC